jgi:hypothetical protein
MRPARPTPSLVPDYDVTVHVVLDDFGKIGRAYREVDQADPNVRGLSPIHFQIASAQPKRFATC